MPITWKNIDLQDNRSANSLLVQGAEGITSGLDKLGAVAKQQTDLIRSNAAAQDVRNTDEVIAGLSNISNSGDLATAMQTGGALETTGIQAKYGRGSVDLGKIAAAARERKDYFTRLDTENQIHNDKLKYDTEQQRMQAARDLREGEHQKNSYKLQQQQVGLALADHQRMIDTKEETRKFESYAQSLLSSTPDRASAERGITQYIANGYANYKHLDKAQMDTIYKATATRFDAGPLSPELAQTATKVDTLYTNATTAVGTAWTKYEREFKRVHKVDDTIVQLQSKQEPHGPTNEYLMRGLFEGADKLSEQETENVGVMYNQIKDRFSSAGVEATPALMKDLFQRFGHGDGWLNVDNDEYSKNDALVREYIEKAYTAKEFTSGALADTLREDQAALMTNKNAMVTAHDAVSRSLKQAANDQHRGASLEGAAFKVAAVDLSSFTKVQDIDKEGKEIKMSDMEYQAKLTLDRIQAMQDGLTTTAKRIAEKEAKDKKDKLDAARLQEQMAMPLGVGM